ncbi:acetoacetate decarboxylase [Paraburkholderia sp. IW21]|uniref:acetoacetate decarboxylase n=1 Tax=Paraburkholderia sp. IW21 TaxID=3242488 RepID=UPI0035223AF7
MKINSVLPTAFSMPLTSPAFPTGPYHFVDREVLIITYRTDPARLRAVVPEPLEVREPLVHFEFIRTPDATGFGDYTESGQVIPVTFDGVAGSYTLAMYVDDHPPIAAGRELWGFPKKLARPELGVHTDTLVGTLDYGPVRIATATMGYKHHALNLGNERKRLKMPNFLLKVLPHVDGKPRVCELVRYHLENIELKGAWTGPSSLQLSPHALAPVADLPVLEIVEARHLIADLTLDAGERVFDYLDHPQIAAAPSTRRVRASSLSFF